MKQLTELEKSYIGGFLDGDGSVNAQIVRRKDYVLKFQIRVSVTFFQSTKRKWFLILLKKKLKMGTIRNKPDGVSELAIVGADSVRKLLLVLKPYIFIKRRQTKLVLSIIEKLPQSKRDPRAFLTLCTLVDKFEFLNDSKKREVTSVTVRKLFTEKRMLELF
uniref:Putative site-specific DNA endonuclease n=1 Tax=Chaetophora sp. FACHB-2423 TaxID=2725789 RepID=A0A6H1XDV1_9CHLO|nr:putative site-specific DNA endonuclease [Chaetophora sp. FACHB-2423]